MSLKVVFKERIQIGQNLPTQIRQNLPTIAKLLTRFFNPFPAPLAPLTQE